MSTSIESDLVKSCRRNVNLLSRHPHHPYNHLKFIHSLISFSFYLSTCLHCHPFPPPSPTFSPLSWPLFFFFSGWFQTRQSSRQKKIWPRLNLNTSFYVHCVLFSSPNSIRYYVIFPIFIICYIATTIPKVRLQSNTTPKTTTKLCGPRVSIVLCSSIPFQLKLSISSSFPWIHLFLYDITQFVGLNWFMWIPSGPEIIGYLMRWKRLPWFNHPQCTGYHLYMGQHWDCNVIREEDVHREQKGV